MTLSNPEFNFTHIFKTKISVLQRELNIASGCVSTNINRIYSINETVILHYNGNRSEISNTRIPAIPQLPLNEFSPSSSLSPAQCVASVSNTSSRIQGEGANGGTQFVPACTESYYQFLPNGMALRVVVQSHPD